MYKEKYYKDKKNWKYFTRFVYRIMCFHILLFSLLYRVIMKTIVVIILFYHYSYFFDSASFILSSKNKMLL